MRTKPDKLMLCLMVLWAIDETTCNLKRRPTEKEILDHIFKGNRMYPDIRATEARIKKMFEEMRAECLDRL